jgi:hypothetical protein
MLRQLQYTVSKELLQEAADQVPLSELVWTLNQPTDRFFYDPWEIKPEYQNTIWELLYNSLPVSDKGEARIIKLVGASCYASHADIDNRYHLNLSGDKCYLIDLDNNTLHLIANDGNWYDMDAGRRHVAANFGNRPRYQLVIRHLMRSNTLTAPVLASIKFNNSTDKGDARFRFDDVLSPWLNQANIQGIINRFSHNEDTVSFQIEHSYLEELKSILPLGAILQCDYL